MNTRYDAQQHTLEDYMNNVISGDSSDDDDDDDVGVFNNGEIRLEAHSSTSNDGYSLMSHTKHESRMDLRLRRSLCEVETNERELKVFVGTWNLHAQPPPPHLDDFIPPNVYDLYVIGTEECETTIQKSFIRRSKDRWINTVTQLLGDDYIEVAQETLMAMHIIAFIRKNLYHLVTEIETGRVATGIANRIGNKGGVGVCFDIGATSLLFVNCHFAAHQDNVAVRNANFHAINNKMPLRLDEDGESNNDLRIREVDENQNVINGTLSDRFDCVWWMGDLNYRIQGTRRMIDRLITNNMTEVMRANDQLTLQRRARLAFVGFNEGDLNFMPTYKFDPGTDLYDRSPKQRIPSWTDRILYRSADHKSVRLLHYDSVPTIRTSDHRPVYAEFLVRALPPRPSPFIIASALSRPIRTNDFDCEPVSAVCAIQ